MLRTIICAKQGYNGEIAEGINIYIETHKKSAKIESVFNSFQELLELVENGVINSNFLIILGESSDGANVIEQAYFLRKKLIDCFIIFVSEDKNLLEELTNSNVMLSGFIMYPFIDETFQHILNYVFEYYETKDLIPPKEKLAIEFKDYRTETKKIVYEDYKNIVYIETISKKTKYVTKRWIYSEAKVESLEYLNYTNRTTLTSIQEILDERFYRCHNSFIVNLDEIQSVSYESSEIIMKNGDCVNISRPKKKGLKEKLAIRIQK